MNNSIEVSDAGEIETDFDTPTLRLLVVKFYKKYDSKSLANGIDISGIVEWIQENGLHKFNDVLKENYNGEFIKPNELLKKNRQGRYSVAITPDLFTAGEEEKERAKEAFRIEKKLIKFYKSMSEEKKLLPEYRIQFERLINFGVIHGIDKLNVLLKKKYGEGISNTDTASELGEVTEERDNEESAYVVDRDDIDDVKLIADLTGYFKAVKAYDQLEIIEDNVEMICLIGFPAWNKRSKKLYGKEFDGVLVEIGREPWTVDESRDIVLSPLDENGEGRGDQTAVVVQDEGNEVVYEVTALEKTPFDKLSDEEIRKELVAFYEFYDADNLEKIEDLVSFSREMGRDKLNNYLMSMYGSGLRDDRKYKEANISATLERTKKQNKQRKLENELTRGVTARIPVQTLGIKVEEEQIEDLEEEAEVEIVKPKTGKVVAVADENQISAVLEDLEQEGDAKKAEEEEKMLKEGRKIFKDKEAKKKKPNLFASVFTRKQKTSLSEIGKKEKKKGKQMKLQPVKSQKTNNSGLTPSLASIPSGRVKKSVKRIEKKIESYKEPDHVLTKTLLTKLKEAQVEQDASNPMIMLSSRNMRKVWVEDKE